METHLPSLSSLRAFEAAARHVSVKFAAQELGVTSGAVSLQIRELEAALGVQLFNRQPRSVKLTSQGEAYFTTLRTAFRMMKEATAKIVAQSRLAVLTVSCTPTFAVQWLVPGLSRFEERHPEIDVRISASNRVADFARDGVDVAIRHGFGRYAGLISERIVADELVPIVSPALIHSGKLLETPADLQKFALLHDEHRHDWRLWLEATETSEVNAENGIVFTDCNGAIEAAKAGQGVALVRLSLVERELSEGSLLTPFPIGVASDFAYHLVYPNAVLERPAVAAFRNWLLSEISAKSQINGY